MDLFLGCVSHLQDIEEKLQGLAREGMVSIQSQLVSVNGNHAKSMNFSHLVLEICFGTHMVKFLRDIGQALRQLQIRVQIAKGILGMDS